MTLLAVQAAPSLASSALIGREASLMSVSPAQNFVNPPPVPDSLTLTSTPGLAALKSSATASEIGRTVLEPSMTIDPGHGGAARGRRWRARAALVGAALAPVDGEDAAVRTCAQGDGGDQGECPDPFGRGVGHAAHSSWG